MTPQDPLEADFLASLFSDTLYFVGGDESIQAKAAEAPGRSEPVAVKPVQEPVKPVQEVAKPTVQPVAEKPAAQPAAEKITLPKVEAPKAPEKVTPVAEPAPVATAIKILGENKREVLILTEDKQNEFLSDSDAVLLGKIIAAVGLQMNDVAVVNIAHYPALDWMKLRAEVKYRYMIAFTPSAALLHKNLQVPLYTIKRASTLDFLISDTLGSLEQSIELKKKLWGNLKGFLQ